jgi:L-rhamnose mutarotase
MSAPTHLKKPARYGMVLRVRPERFEEYRKLHAAVWPEVLATISRCHIRNYTIYHREAVLFSTFEYWGDDFSADMMLMASDPATRRWWAIMEPMQDPYPDRPAGEWWSRMEEVFHHD